MLTKAGDKILDKADEGKPFGFAYDHKTTNVPAGNFRPENRVSYLFSQC